MSDAVRKRQPLDDPAGITLLFIVFQIVYLVVVVVLFSESDQNRYRVEVSAYFAVLLGLLLTAVWRRPEFVAWRERRLGAPRPAEPS
jgi:uncharacterized membrane protein YqjE